MAASDRAEIPGEVSRCPPCGSLGATRLAMVATCSENKDAPRPMRGTLSAESVHKFERILIRPFILMSLPPRWVVLAVAGRNHLRND
jgi:hypothetical protein